MNKYALLFTITLIFQACALEKKQNMELDKVVSTIDELLEHSHEFDKAEVVKVTSDLLPLSLYEKAQKMAGLD